MSRCIEYKLTVWQCQATRSVDLSHGTGWRPKVLILKELGKKWPGTTHVIRSTDKSHRSLTGGMWIHGSFCGSELFPAFSTATHWFWLCLLLLISWESQNDSYSWRHHIFTPRSPQRKEGMNKRLLLPKALFLHSGRKSSLEYSWKMFPCIVQVQRTQGDQQREMGL